jgi:hypothetical protein
MHRVCHNNRGGTSEENMVTANSKFSIERFPGRRPRALGIADDSSLIYVLPRAGIYYALSRYMISGQTAAAVKS